VGLYHFNMIVKVQIDTKDKKFAEELVKLVGLDFVGIEEEKRTSQQNKALHLFFTQLADTLNDAGCDMYKTLDKALPLPWTAERVKEFMWRPLQKHLTDKKSTRELAKEDIDKIYEVLNNIIGGRTGVHVPFPSEEELRLRSL